MRPGHRNSITDIAGLRVGNAEDHAIKTGVTVLTANAPFTAAVHVMGGAPGTRETDALAPDRLAQEVDALVLAGGSAFGLDAAGGVAEELRACGRGFAVGNARVPIVPAAILFDLLNGGDKEWSENPYAALGRSAFAAAGQDFALGTAGAGTGATTATLKGGLGSASLVLPSGHTVGALVAVNALGAANVGDTAHFWAAPFEIGSEFGNAGPAAIHPDDTCRIKSIQPRAATSIAIVATDAVLSKTEATRLAVAAHDGIARALIPSHTPFDGDLVFAAATGNRPLSNPPSDLLALGHAAALTLARAIARGVYLATPAPHDNLPCWSDLFGIGPA